jgi:hypothetical protein
VQRIERDVQNVEQMREEREFRRREEKTVKKKGTLIRIKIPHKVVH